MNRWHIFRLRLSWLAPVARLLAWQPARIGIAIVVLTLIATFGLSPAPTNGGEAKARPQAPELEGGVAWLNSSKALTIDDLKGRVVLLDFWTLCCINCIHTLPDLAKLEAKYPGVLVVIGVHTPKFDNEKDTESIKKAILRYEIHHPVVNDEKMAIWRRYGVRSWPTLVLIDAEGNVVAKGAGEGLYEALDLHIGKLVKEAKDLKILKQEPIKFDLL